MKKGGEIHEFAVDGMAAVFREALLLSEFEDELVLPSWVSSVFDCSGAEFIGRGGSGAVWKVRSRDDGGWLALKIIEFSGDIPLARERWLREAAVAEAVSHPNLLKILDKGTAPDDQSAWLALEWIDGSDLSRVLEEQGPLSWATVAPWLDPIFEALSLLHTKGIVHRDLKPSNFLLEEHSGRVVISDFGATLPIEVDRFTRTTDALVSFGYAAPEQLKAGGEIDARTDQYSLATSLWELLAGELPMGDFPKLKKKNSQVPFWLDSVLRKALARDPQDRFATLEEFSRQLKPAPHHWRRLFKFALFFFLIAGGVYGLTVLRKEPPAVIVEYKDKTFRSPSVRVVEGIDVFIRFNITVSVDGIVSGIINTYSEETWRGMKTQGAIALKDENGKALLVIVAPNFGVTGEIQPGNGSSRSDYIQMGISPEIARQVADLDFMAHPSDDQLNSPWYRKYPEVRKEDAHSALGIIKHEEDNVTRRERGEPTRPYPLTRPHNPIPKD